jgi:hypothetical protein
MRSKRSGTLHYEKPLTQEAMGCGFHLLTSKSHSALRTLSSKLASTRLASVNVVEIVSARSRLALSGHDEASNLPRGLSELARGGGEVDFEGMGGAGLELSESRVCACSRAERLYS